MTKAKKEGAQSLLGPFYTSKGFDNIFEDMRVTRIDSDAEVGWMKNNDQADVKKGKCSLYITR